MEVFKAPGVGISKVFVATYPRKRKEREDPLLLNLWNESWSWRLCLRKNVKSHSELIYYFGKMRISHLWGFKDRDDISGVDTFREINTFYTNRNVGKVFQNLFHLYKWDCEFIQPLGKKNEIFFHWGPIKWEPLVPPSRTLW